MLAHEILGSPNLFFRLSLLVILPLVLASDIGGIKSQRTHAKGCGCRQKPPSVVSHDHSPWMGKPMNESKTISEAGQKSGVIVFRIKKSERGLAGGSVSKMGS